MENNNNNNRHQIRKDYMDKHIELISRLGKSIEKHKQTLKDKYGINLN